MLASDSGQKVFPEHTLDTRGMSDADSFETWREAVRHSYELERIAYTGHHTGYMFSHQIGEITVGELNVSPQGARLLPKTRRTTDPEAIELRASRFGITNTTIEGETVRTGPGAIHGIDLSRPMWRCGCESGHISYRFVAIPHRMIGYDPSQHGSHGALPTDVGSGRLLAAALEIFAGTRPDIGVAEIDKTAEGFAALVRALMLGSMKSESDLRAVEGARRTAIKGYIEENLSNPSLSVADVCRVFGASRATIYRDFAEVGGIRSYIRSRRLDAARQQLAKSSPKWGLVAKTSEHWGFDCPASFARAFKDVFGEAPGDVIGRERSEDRGD